MYCSVVGRNCGVIMVNLFKKRFSLCTFTTAFLFFAHNVDVHAIYFENVVCSENVIPFRCADGKRYVIHDKTYQKTEENKAKEVAIEVSGKDTLVDGQNIFITDISDKNTDLKKNFWKYGIKADNYGNVEIGSGGIHLSRGIGVHTGEWGKVGLWGVYIIDNGIQEIDLDNHEQGSAFQMTQEGGSIYYGASNVKVANAHGISLLGKEGWVDIVHSNVSVNSDVSYGIRFVEGEKAGKKHTESASVKKDSYTFFGEKDLFGSLPKTNLPMRGEVYLRKTSFKVPYSTAIYSNKSGGRIRLLEKSEISGDLLLKAEGGALVKISANDSVLVGGVHIDESSSAEFRLTGGSKWTLSLSKSGNEKLRNFGSIGDSLVSLMQLIDSSIVFEKNTDNTMSDYQTLRIGKGEGVVYQARGDAHIYFNTYLNKGGAIRNQKTDRLLIYGDIEGKTIIHMQSVSGSPGGKTGSGGNNQGISIIQVSGKAEEESFQLDGDYVALEGLPYQYKLYAYGPGSHLGKADSVQRLVEGKGDFWDFRLESRNVQSFTDYRHISMVSERTLPARASSGDVVPASFADSLSKIENVFPSGRGVRSVVPQVPTYLLLPNSLFHAGLMDISNQNKQLEIVRTHPSGMLEIRENSASFLRGYGGSYRYVSDLSALKYGYGGDLGYYALETGVLLQKIENVDSAISFGVMGSYGKLSLQPRDVAQSQKSTFDKWTATVYGSMQHDAGFYVDGLLSYGLFKGDVLTTARGKTATLKGNPLSVSLMSGQKITTGYEGVVFDPQVQVVYQHLQFNEARDIDNFNIEMDKLDQLMVRVGGRLMKTLTASEKDRDVSFYGKIHFAHDFGKERAVRFKDSFQLGAFGSSLEAGLGLNARLSQKFALHGDLVYQHKLSKGGFSGISFSGGLRYRF